MTREKLIKTLFIVALFCFGAFFAPTITQASGPDPNDPFGIVIAPDGVRDINSEIFLTTGDARGIGIFIFLSRILQLTTIVAGIIILFNFIISGFTYLTAEGNPKAHETVRNRVTYSVIGILIIVCAYTITGLIGLIFFGDASYILNPIIIPPAAP